MKLKFTDKFLKHLSKLASKKIASEIEKVIQQAETADNITDLRNVKKLKGYQNYYRIRVGDYRIGLYYENNILEFSAFHHRKDIYKYFP